MLNKWEIAGGSVIGKDHLRTFKNNQDAFYWKSSEHALIAVVSDGCGSSPYSEVGAQLGARFIANQLLELTGGIESFDPVSVMAVLFDRCKNFLKSVASQVDSTYKSVNELLLFSIVGCVVRKDLTVIFSIGDGYYDHAQTLLPVILEPQAGNSPSYLSYALFGQDKVGGSGLVPTGFNLEVISGENPDYLLLGSDGILNLIKAEEQVVPGKNEKIGSLSQFWQEDKYFKNSDEIRRRLTVINRDYKSLDQFGPLHDDTTLIVLRKRR